MIPARISSPLISLYLGILLSTPFGMMSAPGKAVSATTGPSSIFFNPDSWVEVDMNQSFFLQVFDETPSLIKMWAVRYNSWQSLPASENTTYMRTEFRGLSGNASIDEYSFDPADLYNNSYDYFGHAFSGPDSLTIGYSYRFTLYGRYWQIPEALSLQEYDNATPFYQFYTGAQPYCEVTDPAIQSVSASLTHSLPGVAEKIAAIYYYLCEHMTYTEQTKPLGAKKALAQLQGDCSEYSSLMVALLRAAGIPARKALGVALVSGSIASPRPRYSMTVGESWTYSSEDDAGLPLHAWVQYWIPTIGWVSCDPTWGATMYKQGRQYAQEYLHRMDHIHLLASVGDWYGEGISPSVIYVSPYTTGIPELPIIYPLGNAKNFSFATTMTFRVVNASIGRITGLPFNLGEWLPLVFSSGSALIMMCVCGAYCFKRSSNRKHDLKYKF